MLMLENSDTNVKRECSVMKMKNICNKETISVSEVFHILIYLFLLGISTIVFGTDSYRPLIAKSLSPRQLEKRYCFIFSFHRRHQTLLIL